MTCGCRLNRNSLQYQPSYSFNKTVKYILLTPEIESLDSFYLLPDSENKDYIYISSDGNIYSDITYKAIHESDIPNKNQIQETKLVHRSKNNSKMCKISNIVKPHKSLDPRVISTIKLENCDSKNHKIISTLDNIPLGQTYSILY